MSERKQAARRAASYLPSPARVSTATGGRPNEVDGHSVEALREEWLVEDRWWTSQPVWRHYYELVLDSGKNTVVYRDGRDGGWYEQRG